MSIYEDKLILIYCVLLAFIIGAVMGSFLNCAAMRICRKESLARGRSHCMSCGHVLKAGDLLPIVSWLFRKGRCRYCSEKISVRYPLTELIMALCSVLCLLACDISWLGLRNWLFICILFWLSLVDLEIYEIPNRGIIAAAVIWAAALPLMEEPVELLKWGLIAGLSFGVGLLVISLIMDKILKKDTLGGGDIKLFFAIGLYLGVVKSLFTLLAACVIGLLMALLMKGRAKEQFPFGPAIAGAAFLMLLYGQPLADWYQGLL